MDETNAKDIAYSVADPETGAMPAGVGEMPTLAKPLPFAEAKAAYLAETERMIAAGKADDRAQSEYGRLCPKQPRRTIEYDHPGFTSGAVTMAPYRTSQELAPWYVDHEEAAEAFKDHPGYLEYCSEYRSWQELSDAIAAQVGMETAEEAYETALSDQMIAWRAMATSVVGSHAELLDKIDTCRADSILSDAPDGDAAATFLDAVSRDLRALIG